MKLSRKSRQRQGSVLLLTLFLLIVMAMLGTGFMVLLPVEMRSAHKDRAAVMTSYGADGALQAVMNDLRAKVPLDDISRSAVEMGGGWSYQVENVEQLADEQFRVTTVGLLRGKALRRAVAIIDDGSQESALYYGGDASGGAQTINQNGAWPTTVPIVGDVFVNGTWYVDNSVTPATPPFQGAIHQTEPLNPGAGVGARGEKYTGTVPTTAAQYGALYTQGMDAIQRTGQVPASDRLTSDQVNKNLLMAVFGLPDSSGIAASKSAYSGAGVQVPSTGSTMSGGIYINPKGSSDFSIDFSVDANGNGVMTVANGSTVTTITSVTEGGTYGGTTIASTDDRLVVSTGAASGGATTTTTSGGGNGNGNGGGSTATSGSTGGGGTGKGNGKGGGGSATGTSGTGTSGTSGTTAGGGGTSGTTGGGSTGGASSATIYNADFSEGFPVYVNGDVVSVKGTYKGSMTVASAGDMTITGELLKSGWSAGDLPGDTDGDAESDPTNDNSLGLVACVNAGNNSKGMSLDLSGAPIPSNGEFYIYAYLTSLSANDNVAKMLSNPQHPDLPNGTKFNLVGSLYWAPTTPGQINTATRFLGTFAKQLVLDPERPPFFPGPNSFIPRIRSYVDIPVGE